MRRLRRRFLCPPSLRSVGILAAAVKAGGTLLKPGKRAEWGGDSGYFVDPDGHAWEIAFNPAWSIDAEGRVSMDG